jgi:hypothetical protein
VVSIPTSETLDLIKLLKFLQAAGAAPAGPSQPSAQLQALLDAIPFANDGDVITADHHNSLKKAIGQIAASLDETQFAQVQTLAFTPLLQPVVDQPPWRITLGKALGSDQGPDAIGWMALDLPNGANVDSFRIRGSTPSKPSFWNAELRRYLLVGDDDPALVAGGEFQDKIPAAGGTVSQSFPARIEDLTVAVAAELRRIDNSKYRYVFQTTLDSPQAAAVELTLVEVTCTR